MAIDMSAENSSPRISFSHDLHQTEDPARTEENDNCYHQQRRDNLLLETCPDKDFDFCVSNNWSSAEICSAEDLFSDGLIRPLQLQGKHVISRHESLPKLQSHNSLSPFPPNGISIEEDSKESAPSNIEPDQQKIQGKFSDIKRSSSVHCDNSQRRSSFWSLPLLSRSYSTGSEAKVVKENQKQNMKQKAQKNYVDLKQSSSGVYMHSLAQKPPLRKKYVGYEGNGMMINPVLNVPAPNISKKTANLLGLGSFFGNDKEKKIKK